MIEKVKPEAVKSVNINLEDRFSSGAWRKRGDVTLWFDSNDSLVSASVDNIPVEEAVIAKEFEEKCAAQELYQLRLLDYDLVTSQDACQYFRQGLNETLTFFADK